MLESKIRAPGNGSARFNTCRKGELDEEDHSGQRRYSSIPIDSNMVSLSNFPLSSYWYFNRAGHTEPMGDYGF
jgi:hypothetical protein